MVVYDKGMSPQVRDAMQQRMLVVSDDQHTRTLLTEMFSEEGFQVYTTPDEERGLLSQFSLIRPAVTIVDILNTGGCRLETVERIREMSSVPVIALAACKDSGVLIESLDRGADYFMTKPFSTRELQARVRALLRRAQYAARCAA